MAPAYWSRWRLEAMEVIARVLKETEGRSDKEIRQALREAYPFGEKAMYPYKVWLDEIRRQMKGERTSLSKSRDRRNCSPQTFAYQRKESALREWEQIYGRRSE